MPESDVDLRLWQSKKKPPDTEAPRGLSLGCQKRREADQVDAGFDDAPHIKAGRHGDALDGVTEDFAPSLSARSKSDNLAEELCRVADVLLTKNLEERPMRKKAVEQICRLIEAVKDLEVMVSEQPDLRQQTTLELQEARRRLSEALESASADVA